MDGDVYYALRVIKAFTERANCVTRLFRVKNLNISMLAIFESEVIMRRSNYSAPIPPGTPGDVTFFVVAPGFLSP